MSSLIAFRFLHPILLPKIAQSLWSVVRGWLDLEAGRRHAGQSAERSAARFLDVDSLPLMATSLFCKNSLRAVGVTETIVISGSTELY